MKRNTWMRSYRLEGHPLVRIGCVHPGCDGSRVEPDKSKRMVSYALSVSGADAKLCFEAKCGMQCTRLTKLADMISDKTILQRMHEKFYFRNDNDVAYCFMTDPCVAST